MNNIWHVVQDDGLAHVDEAVEFLQREFGPAVSGSNWSAEYFRWKLGPTNPAGTGYLSLAMAGGRVVGTVSLTRKRLFVGGKEFSGGEVGDSYSAASLRRTGRPGELWPGDPNPDGYLNRSIFGRLAAVTRVRAEAGGVEIIYGTPNRNAYPGWTGRLDYFDWKQGGLTAFVRPTAKLLIARYPRTAAFGGALRALDAMAAGGLKLAQAFLSRRDQVIERGAPALAELDELWRRTRHSADFSLVRDGAYWAHRYVAHPFARYQFFSVRRSGRLEGVVVTRVMITASGRRQVSIVEWMKEPALSLGWLMAEIVHFHREEDPDFYHLYAGNGMPETNALARNLFLHRMPVPVVVANNSAGRRLQADTRRAELHLGNTDAA